MRDIRRGASALMLWAVLPSVAASEAWACRNTEWEIRCEAGRCTSAPAFTPLSIALDTAGVLSVCAYSGCWSGLTQRTQAGPHQVAVGLALAWQGEGQREEDFVLLVDSRDRVGWLKGAGLATPVHCERPTD